MWIPVCLVLYRQSQSGQEDQKNITKASLLSPFPTQPMQQLSSLSLPTAEYMIECFKQSSPSEQGELS